MHRVLRVALSCAVGLLLAAAPAAAQPVLSVVDVCAYTGGQFVVVGTGFAPSTSLVVEVMGTEVALEGTPLSTHEVTTDASGRFDAVLDVPPGDGLTPAARSVRVRAAADDAIGLPVLLAAAPLKTAARGVSVTPAGHTGPAARVEHWRIVGLPEGTRLYAHYRHGRATVARVALAVAHDPCGVAEFDLRTLPAGHERAGRWELWITSRRAFRIPRQGVYVARPMDVTGAGAGARVTSGPLRMRLVPSDPRAIAPVTNAFAADTSKIGVISLQFLGADGAPVDYFERIGDRLDPLGTVQAPPGALSLLENATTWSCTRLTRRFVASATLPDGSLASGAHTVRTPSCESRFRISVPARVRPGGEIAVRVVDRWGTGAIRPTLCLTRPGGAPSCARLVLPAAVTIATRRVRADRRGVWRIELRVAGARVRTSVEVGAGGRAARAAPTLLATGDSTMQGIDGFLADELGAAARVRSDVRPGTGISKPDTDWTQIAAAQAAALRPRTTVISIGAADGFDMTLPDGTTAPCCDEPWVAEYARRVGAMMRAYRRGRRGRVYWLTLPAPRIAARMRVTSAINTAIARAAQGLAGVKIVRLDLLFTPDGYRDVIRYRGRNVRVREIDGIHLNVAGAAIAARAIVQLIRRDG